MIKPSKNKTTTKKILKRKVQAYKEEEKYKSVFCLISWYKIKGAFSPL